MQASIAQTIDNQDAILTYKDAFKSATTPEEGAAAFTQLVHLARKTEMVERSRVERVEAVVDFVEPTGDVQTAAVLMAKLNMGFEPSLRAF